MFRVFVAITLMLLTLIAWPVLAENGQDDQGDKSSKKSVVDKSPSADSAKPSVESRPAKRKEAPVLIPEREAAALAFAEKYHSDLGQLLVFLQENNPNAYRQAVYDLYRTSQRLAMHHDRGDKERYQLELKLWQAQSRGQLIVARMKMTATTQLEKQLREALAEQMELRSEILRRDREKTADRLKKLDDQIVELNQDRQGEIQRQIDLLVRSAKSKTVTIPPRGSKQAKPSDETREPSLLNKTNP